MMKYLKIVGRKNHGKTTLILQLVAEFTRRGYRVGTIKHTSHIHELDRPGTDSQRQRQAGAAPSAIVTGDLVGVFIPYDPQVSDYQEFLASLYSECDLILVEGDLDGSGDKIEVWRKSLGTPPLAETRPDITAVVTDDLPTNRLPIFPRKDLEQLVEYIQMRICNWFSEIS